MTSFHAQLPKPPNLQHIRQVATKQLTVFRVLQYFVESRKVYAAREEQKAAAEGKTPGSTVKA